MPLTVLGFDGGPFNQSSIEAVGARFLRSYVRIVPTGAYVAGGDTLDLTNGGAAAVAAAPAVIPQSQSRGLASIIIKPVGISNTSLANAGGKYQVRLPLTSTVPTIMSLLNALLLKIFTGVPAEYAAGAYGADVLADTIIAELIWAR